jgi:hypothetical protein
MIETQKAGFTDLYNAFYNFFLESIRQDSSICNKIRLQTLTQYFDELPLYKVINPIITRINSNVEDRRAISRAALWDALFAHHNGQMFKFYETHELKAPEPVGTINDSAFVTIIEGSDKFPISETATFSSAPEPVFTEIHAKRGRGRPAGKK